MASVEQAHTRKVNFAESLGLENHVRRNRKQRYIEVPVYNRKAESHISVGLASDH